MEAHHLRVIERLTEKFKDDPRYLALVVGGSLVKGRGQVNSDVDIFLVASDEEYALRWQIGRLVASYAGIALRIG